MPAAALRLPVLASLLLLAALGNPAWAQYRWKDAQGQLHASDQPPPPGIPDKDVLQRPPAGPRKPVAAAAAIPASAASATGLAARAPVDPELQQRKARADMEAKARAKEEEQRLASQRAENCQRARQHLATLATGNRLVRYNDRGERVVLDDNQRAQEAAQARNVLSSDCR